MDRENYYIILELTVDPPENDSSVIERAIQNKKVQWSRLRNHPTKGLQAQKYINMIPDIQKVMLDEELRKQEADAAAELLEQGRESKISEIDSHIDILMGKGYIAKEDIVRLADIHGLSQAEINDRIAAKKDARYSRIDQFISLRMAKGYLLESELAKIAKKHAMEPQEIRKRVRCPILKDEKEAGALSIRPLDKSLEKAIAENLKIVGSKNLYDFLGVGENADLKQVQEKAARKNKSLAAIGKKDAVVTAGQTLAGQCLILFKKNETRLSYDICMARAKLSALDSDIQIAAINNKIRYEYFDALVNRAVEFGMDKDEAITYIEDFCQAKKYRIEKKPETSRRVLFLTAACGILLVALVAGYFALSHLRHTKSVEKAYQQVAQKVKTAAPDKKITLLRQYLAAHGNSKYEKTVRDQINQIESEKRAAELSEILKTADQLIQTNNLDKASVFLKQSLENARDAGHQKAIRQHLAAVSEMIEKQDFETLSDVSMSGEPDQKIALYQQYLKNHPEGKHKAEVQSLIDAISNEYFIYISKMISFYAKQEKWEDCLQLCQAYIDIYDNSHSDQLKQMIPEIQDNIRNKKIYATLVDKAGQLEPDYQAALGIYEDFLAAYPESPLNEDIRRQIMLLNKKIAVQKAMDTTSALRKKLAATRGRFVEKQEGVVLDTRTGLMWSLLDSDAETTGTCLPYAEGKAWVADLHTGGFTDWRLPTPEELSGILETTPAFPVSGKKTYWTADSYSAYSDGWQTHVTTLSADNESGNRWATARKNALECGTVRAVRDP